MCFDYPSESTCAFAAEKCCAHERVEVMWGIPESCFCDFYTSIKNVHSYETEHRSGNCSDAEELALGADESSLLSNLYWNIGGDYWYKNTGWNDWATPYCERYGITCNEYGWVTKINL